MAKPSKNEIAAQIAALRALLAEDDGGVYEDPTTGRWFIVVRPCGRTRTTTRRRAPDGSRLRTRELALVAKGQWEAQLATGAVAIGRERIETYWPRYLRHAKADMTQGSWEDVRAHGTKRRLPYFGELQMSKIGVPAVRDRRATVLEAVEAGEWRRRPSTTRGSRCSAGFGWRSRTA